ncbi:MAG: aminotransferase class V-fold PLP-dependent enzyme [Selenomonadaceae bacterium]|nr:aminotransferase class V-fold PLP-dependent enzyme [Selenomonadaceae bacterium]
MIYFDNAATTMPKPASVTEAVVAAMNSFGNSGRAAHGQSMDASRTIYEARVRLAGLFNCPRPSNVVFTANSTEALNIAIRGLLKPGDHVISTDLEHNSVLRPLYDLAEQGVAVDFAAADRQGRINHDDFSSLLRENTRAIVCTHGSNLTGNLLDIGRIGRFAHEHGLLFIVDASQTAGVFPIDMAAMNISVLCFTGHKSLLGPQGTGGLCIADGVEIRPLKSGGTGVQTYLRHQPPELPTRLEAGTLNSHGIAGLLAAVGYIESVGMENIRAKESALMKRFYDGVKEIPGMKVYGDFDNEKAPIVSLNWQDVPSGELADELAEEYGIASRAGAHCAPRLHEALGTKGQGAVRFSFGYHNTEEEVDRALSALRKICQ